MEKLKELTQRAPSLIGIGAAGVVGAMGIIPEPIQPPLPFVPSNPKINPEMVWGAENGGFLAPQVVGYRIEPPKPWPASSNLEKTTIPSVLYAMGRYRGSVFAERDFTDIRMYFDIYKAAGELYGVDWRILWALHDKETICSYMKETDQVKVYVWGYDKSGKPIENHLYGAMQRSINFFPDSKAEVAYSPLRERLKGIRTRVSTDAREIAWAAKRLSQLLKEGKGDLIEALVRYSARKPAVKRWENYNLFSAYLPK